MCLPFLCGGHEDHGSTAHNDTRQHHQPTDHGDGTYQPYDPIAVAPSPLKPATNHGYVVGGVGKNGAAGGNAVTQQGRRAADVTNKNGETGAAMYISDSDVPASVGRGRKGAAEKLIPASTPAWQAHGQMETKMAVPTTTTPQAPERKEHVAPVQQVARRDDDDSPYPPAATAAAERASQDSTSSVSRWK